MHRCPRRQPPQGSPPAHRCAAIGAAKHLHVAAINNLGSGRCTSAKDIANTSIDERPNGTAGYNALATAWKHYRAGRHATGARELKPAFGN